MDLNTEHIRRYLPAVCLLLCVCAQSGCVSRRLTIRSDPPGALVELDGVRIGTTPVTTDFTYYATREITLSKVGYETLTIQQPVPPPWYQVPPLDFFSDNFSPVQVTNRHDFTYRLAPQRLIGEDELLDRASGARTRAQVGR
ncbi:MAG: PEGA domain-containing protein [Planctomycetaceae bacterium]|nr:PEGA domain-containing protein [Planctomycetaceae bacterium]